MRIVTLGRERCQYLRGDSKRHHKKFKKEQPESGRKHRVYGVTKAMQRKYFRIGRGRYLPVLQSEKMRMFSLDLAESR